MNKISVLLADDHAVVRQGLRLLLSAEPDIEVVGEAENGRQAVQMAERLRPKVIVMDLAMPQLNGMEAARQIIDGGGTSKLLILSSYADDEYFRQLTEVGAHGYLIKQTAAADLIRAVRTIARGNSFFSPVVSKRLASDHGLAPVEGQPRPRCTVKLTHREQEVLQLVAEGNSNKQIASLVCISIKTVEKHRQHLMDKLGIHETAGLTRYALSHGVVKDTARIGLAPETLAAPEAVNASRGRTR